MKGLYFLVMFLFSLNALAEVKEVGCGPRERDALRRGLRQDKIETQQLLRELDHAINRNDTSWNTWRKLQVARLITRCAYRKLTKLQYVCATGVPLAAITYPVISNKVYFGPRYFQGGQAPGIFLHEATHHCGANDARYLDDGDKPEDVGVRGWQSIASTYQYWLFRGFCVPGEC